MHVMMLTTCEDTNMERTYIPETFKWRIGYRTELLREGEVYDLPDDQAENLKRLGYAADPAAAEAAAEAPTAGSVETGGTAGG